MKINTKPFRDFYDGMCFGLEDNSVFYNRVTSFYSLSNTTLDSYQETIEEQLKQFMWKTGSNSVYIKPVLLGFCGVVYPAYYSYRLDKINLNLGDLWECECKRLTEKFKLSKPPVFREDKFKPIEKINHLEHFINVDSPIFIYCSYKRDLGLFKRPFYMKDIPPMFEECLTTGLVNITTVTNINLKQIGFHNVLDQYQTYQEIEMFLGNVLTKPEAMPAQSDVGKRDSHGFDDKSFKQASPGKKLKRRKR